MIQSILFGEFAQNSYYFLMWNIMVRTIYHFLPFIHRFDEIILFCRDSFAYVPTLSHFWNFRQNKSVSCEIKEKTRTILFPFLLRICNLLRGNCRIKRWIQNQEENIVSQRRYTGTSRSVIRITRCQQHSVPRKWRVK